MDPFYFEALIIYSDVLVYYTAKGETVSKERITEALAFLQKADRIHPNHSLVKTRVENLKKELGK